MKINSLIIILFVLLAIPLLTLLWWVITGASFVAPDHSPDLLQLLYIILFGFFPPILWLIFWAKEDPNPEPGREIFVVFFAGFAVVALAIFLENYYFKANQYFKEVFQYSIPAFQMSNILGFALIEELCKLLAAVLTALRSKYFDEPVDAMIYMVTAAMGFAALENILFIADSLQTSVNQTILVSAFRFINAILLHASTAILIGSGLAFSYFHHERRWKELGSAIILATLLHASYNFFIINNMDRVAGVPGQVIATFLVLFGAVTGLLLFERVRRIIKI